ncbi:MAG: DUF6327 family protein [Leeuwenhoekiella sp.]
MKIYTSFEQIDKDLKILKLQQQIDKEQIKLNGNTLKSSFSPMGLVTNVIGAVAQKAFVLKMVNKLLGIKRVKKVDD